MPADDPAAESAEHGQRVQCPNCCRMAPVVRREHGLIFYECELCLTTGAVPEGDDGQAAARAARIIRA